MFYFVWEVSRMIVSICVCRRYLNHSRDLSYKIQHVQLSTPTTPRLNNIKLWRGIIKKIILYRYSLSNYYHLVLVVGGWLLQKWENFQKNGRVLPFRHHTFVFTVTGDRYLISLLSRAATACDVIFRFSIRCRCRNSEIDCWWKRH